MVGRAYGEGAGAHEPCVSPRIGQRSRETLEPVASVGSLFEPFLLREMRHPDLERPEELAGGGEGGDQPPDELSVALAVVRPSHGARHRPMSASAHGREPRPPSPSSGSSGGREDLLQRCFASRARARPGNGPRTCTRRRREAVRDLEPGNASRVELEVGGPTPHCLAGCTGLVARISRASTTSASSSPPGVHIASTDVDLVEQVLDLLAFVAVEVGATRARTSVDLPT